MEKTVTVRLFKDSDGQYGVNVNPLIVTVAPLDEDGNPVNINWVLVEDPSNSGIPNARLLTTSFDASPTPFTVSAPGAALPPPDNFVTADNSNGAMATTPNVQDSAVGPLDENSKLYKYTITVETNDNQRIIVDPHVRVIRRRISRDHRDD